MYNALKQLPCGSIKEIKDSFTVSPRFGYPLSEVTQMKFDTLYEVFNQLDRPDQLTNLIYSPPDMEGNYTFPLVGEPGGLQIRPIRGKLGLQISGRHKEDIKQQAALTATKLVQKMYSLDFAVLFAVLSSTGKKYCCGTNSNGEICFTDANKVSAYLAAAWMLKYTFTATERIWEIVGEIFKGSFEFGCQNYDYLENSSSDIQTGYKLIRKYDLTHKTA